MNTVMTTMEKQTSPKVKRKSIYSIKQPRGIDYGLMIAVVLLAIYGILMVGSASMGKFKEYDIINLGIAVAKPLILAVIGFIAMCWVTTHFDMKIFKPAEFIKLYFFGLASLFLCLLFPANYGAHAWITIPMPFVEISIQPSEFCKIIAMFVVASYLAGRTKSKLTGNQMFLRPLMLIGTLVLVIMLVQNDTGSAAIIFLISCVCLLIPDNEKFKWWQFGLRAAFWVVVLLGIFLIATKQGEDFIRWLPIQEFQINRFITMINPFADEYDNGYQLIKGLTAFASGGFFGRGYGKSLRKYMSFPQAESDYILAILVEELGYFGFIALMCLYCFIIFKLLGYALKIKDERAKIVLTGTAMYLVFHIFLNIGGVTGMIPLTGVPLPMISAGTSCMWSVMIAIGICQHLIALYRRGELE